MSEQKYNVLDLFCGCGGLSLGFEEAGYNVLLGIDIWEDALKTYAYTIIQYICLRCKESANRMQNIKLA